jgi:hypothetical protein
MSHILDIEAILAEPSPSPPLQGRAIGRSRQGRPIEAFVAGHGSNHFSLIAGCHADEPVGPAMLTRLVTHLLELPSDHPLLDRARWHIVPHVNPDGAAVNAAWSDSRRPATDHLGADDDAYDLLAYLQHVFRELPGDDIEFGFPRHPGDGEARPENLAVAGFLRAGAPFALHASFHGMGLAPGPWFLLEPSWIERTAALRDDLREVVSSMGYRPMDVDRRGEKGFQRIDHGFSTRPDSKAMIAHFEARGDHETARRFRPSSMEWVRQLGGDPLTLVSEMPLFLIPEPADSDSATRFEKGSEGRQRLMSRLLEMVSDKPVEVARRAVAESGVHAMPIRDQMRLQLALLDRALALLMAR